jgi:hypothetical protein
MKIFCSQLNCSSAGQKIDYEHHKCDYEQQVNQVATDATNSADQPQHQKNHKNCPQHIRLLLLPLTVPKVSRVFPVQCPFFDSCPMYCPVQQVKPFAAQ